MMFQESLTLMDIKESLLGLEKNNHGNWPKDSALATACTRKDPLQDCMLNEEGRTAATGFFQSPTR